jgi:predicted enzyme related to lactoylglutathione lyase
MGNPVVHFEINGPDPELIAKFYGELFGWHLESNAELQYTTIDTHGGGGINGGIGSAEKPYTTIYIGADDLQASLDKAVSLGASTTVPVSDIPGVGTFAQFADPDGNLIGLFKGNAPDAPGVSAGSNPPVTWFEIYGKEPQPLWQFYRELFGWTIKESSGDGFVYGEVHAEQGISGGITANPMKQPGVAIWAESDDQQGYLDRAVELGGTAIMPPTEMSDGLKIAMFTDPQGTYCGVYSYKR